MKEFFAMGGYAFYVWTAYGLAAAVMAGNLVAALRCHRAAWQRVRRMAQTSS